MFQAGEEAARAPWGLGVGCPGSGRQLLTIWTQLPSTGHTPELS